MFQECGSVAAFINLIRSIKMNDKHNNVSDDHVPQLDAEFYATLGWLTALSASIANWACIA